MSHRFLITTAHNESGMEIINLYKLKQKSNAKFNQLKLMKTTNKSNQHRRYLFLSLCIYILQCLSLLYD